MHLFRVSLETQELEMHIRMEIVVHVLGHEVGIKIDSE